MKKLLDSVRIIDSKKIRLTNDEWVFYEKLCRAYDDTHRKGSDFFREHFETNSEGIIVFVRPPHNKFSSLEIYCFLVSIMHNQHLRLVHAQADALVEEATVKYQALVDRVDAVLNRLEASTPSTGGTDGTSEKTVPRALREGPK
jgi:hypothetical protein